jgi:flagellar basal body rod protein FlgG
VDVVKEMVHMLTALREFEAYQKVIQTLEDAVSKINNEIGRI